VRDKAIEEMSESIKALASSKAIINCKTAEELGKEGMTQVLEILHQTVEAQTACQTVIGVLCQQYDLKVVTVYEDHFKELKAKGFVKEVRS